MIRKVLIKLRKEHKHTKVRIFCQGNQYKHKTVRCVTSHQERSAFFMYNLSGSLRVSFVCRRNVQVIFVWVFQLHVTVGFDLATPTVFIVHTVSPLIHDPHNHHRGGRCSCMMRFDAYALMITYVYRSPLSNITLLSIISYVKFILYMLINKKENNQKYK